MVLGLTVASVTLLILGVVVYFVVALGQLIGLGQKEVLATFWRAIYGFAHATYGGFWALPYAAWLLYATWRRQAWPWWLVVIPGIFATTAMVLSASVALLDGAPRGAAEFLLAGLVPGAVVAAYLGRTVRAWFGFACTACGRFRWEMSSPASQRPCRRCGAAYQAVAAP